MNVGSLQVTFQTMKTVSSVFLDQGLSTKFFLQYQWKAPSNLLLLFLKIISFPRVQPALQEKHIL